MLRAPRFTVVAVLTLAAAVGANGAVFGVVNGVLLKPLPYPAPEELVGVWHTAPGVNITDLNMAPSNYFIYREQSRVFTDIGLYRAGQASVTGTGEPEQVPALFVTDGVLPLLGVAPAQGRLFIADDAAAGSPLTALLGHGYWLRKFAGDPTVVGRTIQIDGEARRIVGVLPRGFQFLDQSERDVVLPLQFDRGETRLGQFNFLGLARLKPGVTVEQANADIARMLPIVLQSFPAPPGFSLRLFEEARFGPNVRPLIQDVLGDVGGLLGVVMGGIGLVLLIACANVANLWLVRLEARRQELAVRAALGASRARLAGDLVIECLVLGAVSGAVGLGLAGGGLRVFTALAPESLPRLRDVGLDPVVVLFTLAIALAAGLLIGLLPVLRRAGRRLAVGLRDANRTVSQSRGQRRVRGALVVLQVALALVLLVGSGLMIRTFRAMSDVNPGFTNPAELQVFQLVLPGDVDRVIGAQRAVLERLQALPGVTAAAVASGVPMDGNSSNDPVFVQDHAYREGEIPPIRRFRFVMPGFLETMGTPLVAGRDLTWRELELRAPVALVSRNLAVEHWQTPQAALGKRIRVSTLDDWREIIGVVEDVYDDGVSQDAVATVYWPIVQERFSSNDVSFRRSVSFVVRTQRAGSDALLRDLRLAVWAVNPDLPLFSVRTVDDYYRRSMARTSLTLVLLGVAGGMALLLGVIGLYGVVSYSVAQRTREVGIRMALGAAPQSVTGLFVRDALVLAAAGVAVGLAGAWLTTRLMTALLFEVSAVDPLTYVVVSIGLLATSLLAAYLPSRRAAAVDPSLALRAE